jgi:hypothetical protein
VETGFFYWNNAKWNMLSVEGSQITPVIPGGNGGNSWNDSATNSGTNAGANTNLASGTNTYDDLVFKVIL